MTKISEDANNVQEDMFLESFESEVKQSSKWVIDKKIILPIDAKIQIVYLLKKDSDNILEEDEYLFITEKDGLLKIDDMKNKLKNIKNEWITFDKVKITKNIKSILLMEQTKSSDLPDENTTRDLIESLIDKNKELNKQLKLLIPDNSPSGFLEYYAFKKHVLLQGPKGTSKSYQTFKFISDNKLEHEVMIGHNSIEAMDFLGHFIQTQNGLAWKDGALTAAFRKAKKHGKAVLIIDEMLRIPEKELNVIIGSLSPDYDGNFVLRTGRALGVNSDGFAEEEVLKVPMNSLFVIATTNVGAKLVA